MTKRQSLANQSSSGECQTEVLTAIGSRPAMSFESARGSQGERPAGCENE